MKEKIIYIFWSVVFLLAGAGLLVGYIDYKEIPEKTWFIVEVVASAAFVVTYFLAGTKKWGWLLPAFVLAGMAVDLSTELYHTFLSQPNGVPIMIGVALWFLTGFLMDHKRWGLLIPAYILVFAAVETAINTMIVPSILYGVQNTSILYALTSGAGTMFMLALPFFVVYFVSKKSWWAIIPAGLLASIAVMLSLTILVPGERTEHNGLYSGVLLLGFAMTFGILWLRRKTQPTDWSKFPAVGLLALSILAFIQGDAWNRLSEQTSIAFAVASAIFLIAYLVHGLRKWGWLFPVLICAAIAVTMWMLSNNIGDTPWIGLPILASVALPFYIGFALEPKNRGLLIPAFVMTMLMVISMATDSDYEGVVVMFTFSLPFFAVSFWSRKNWWAFIPAGVFASIGIVALLDIVVPQPDYTAPPFTMEWGVYTWVLFLGFALTFAIPWLLRKDQPSSWTKFPAVGFLALSILNLILAERFQEYWLAVIMFVIAGLFILAILDIKMAVAGQQSREIKV
ncbi:MAG: hypothetical protein C3F13_13175 [Anaerolineales bacterium]|nr:MAG: hypothetical protein C3F13_13175 [Anaerolineales bacterium]